MFIKKSESMFGFSKDICKSSKYYSTIRLGRILRAEKSDKTGEKYLWISDQGHSFVNSRFDNFCSIKISFVIYRINTKLPKPYEEK